MSSTPKRIVLFLAVAIAVAVSVGSAVARHGGAIRDDIPEGYIDRYYDVFTGSETGLLRQAGAALVRLECLNPAGGTATFSTMHVVRTASGVRIYTAGHTYYDVRDMQGARGIDLTQCHLMIGAMGRSLPSCRIAAAYTGLTTVLSAAERNLAGQNRRLVAAYRRMRDTGDASALRALTNADWARYDFTCANHAEAQALESAAIEQCAPSDIRQLAGTTSVGRLRGRLFQSSDGGAIASRSVAGRIGRFSDSASADSGMCTYSNYNDYGMSGGFLAGVVIEAGTERLCSVCILSGQSPWGVAGESGLSSDGTAPMTDAARMDTTQISALNRGTYYPDE